MRALALSLMLVACERPGNPPAPSEPTPPAAPPSLPFVVVDASPTAGPLETQLREHVRRARAQSLAPFVELGATWCPPCQAIQRSMDVPQMRTAFRGTYVVRVDIDDFGPALEPLGLGARAIPKFVDLRDDGHGGARTIDGGAWGEDVPANIAPVLDRYFHGS